MRNMSFYHTTEQIRNRSKAASEMNDLLPDWRERCDELAALRAENERLRAALQVAANCRHPAAQAEKERE